MLFIILPDIFLKLKFFEKIFFGDFCGCEVCGDNGQDKSEHWGIKLYKLKDVTDRRKDKQYKRYGDCHRHYKQCGSWFAFVEW